MRNNRNFEFFWFPKSPLVYSKSMNPTDVKTGGRTFSRLVSDIVNENAAMWLICEINRKWPGSRDWLLEKGSALVPQDTSVQRADGCYATERLVAIRR